MKWTCCICFNTNQFTGDELCRTRDPKIYNPLRLDVRTWVDAMKMAGMRYAVLTTRHTSGFLLWDSATTDYDVGSSGNTTDVVKAFTEECRRQGIAPGLYYCMWVRTGRQLQRDPLLLDRHDELGPEGLVNARGL
jgi:alpha-L-fucosidase